MPGKKIGIMGGTFDPIHYGHLMLAEQIRTSFFLDEILFIPVGKPPHKAHANSADKEQRLEMTRLATITNPYFHVSDIETKRNGTTYTIDTIKRLKESLSPKDQLYFITGADAIILLDTWKNYDELIQLVTFVGATRPGVDLDKLNDKVKQLIADYNAKIEICYIPALAISSTEIRNRVNDEKSIRYLLPESVESYIESKGLYKSHHPQYDLLKDYLRRNLSLHRYEHTIETSKMARKLAVRYGADPLKAEFAGLCHDFAKEIDRESMLKHIENFTVYFDPCIQKNPNLAHGEVGAELLRQYFGIYDESILNAIRWHTYGNKHMSTLSKIIYVADIIEPSRNFEGLSKLRHLAYEDLDQTMIAYYELNNSYLNENKRGIHSYTHEMIDHITRSF
ncbi:MAG: nicotinate-nucleotide adenylyltransferase [Clostridia bacterium]|nr:nicotinate-nucleotide adenylyltransferase [Clostridia bacterium]